MKKINAANTEFAKICLKKDGHVNVHAREHVFVNDSRDLIRRHEPGKERPAEQFY